MQTVVDVLSKVLRLLPFDDMLRRPISQTINASRLTDCKQALRKGSITPPIAFRGRGALQPNILYQLLHSHILPEPRFL
jgi:hypothetical protein